MKFRNVFFLLGLGIGTLFGGEGRKQELPPEAQRALRYHKSVSLYSLEPLGIGPVPGVETSAGLPSHNILGFVLLDSSQAEMAISALKAAIAAAEHKGASCFFPRHALRVTTETKTYDFLICYECDRLDVLVGDTAVGSIGARGSSEVLDNLLRTAHIPLAKRQD